MKIAKKNSKGSDAASADENFNDQAALRNWFLVVLERKWYALGVFLLTVIGTATYTLLSTPRYEGIATVQVLKRGAQVMRVADVIETSVTNDTDFNTQIKILESITLARNVAGRLTADETEQLTEPYKKGDGEGRSPVEIIFRDRKIQPQRFTLVVGVRFQHPNPKIAARIANLIVTEYISYNTRLRVDESLKAVDELKDRAEQQRKRVNDLATQLQNYRQRGNLISLVQSKDIVTDRLKALSQMATQSADRLKDSEIRWNQVQEWTKADRNLAELPFIAAQGNIGQLRAQISGLRVGLEQMKERYKPKMPAYIETDNSLRQAEIELKQAIVTAAAAVKAEFEAASLADTAARKALSDQENKSYEMDKAGLEYEALNREFRVNNQLLESMLERMRETDITGSIEMESARIIDQAFEPAAPLSPRVAMNMIIGCAIGLFLGLMVAYVIAMVDDRVKTTFDVETMVGLPLVGVIPRVPRLAQPEKAQVVSNGSDQAVTESFLSLYSAMRLNDEGKNAKLILVTGTMPGEGKSFVASNLALTFAAQGQRTIIVDCDLRKPCVQRSFRLRTTKGVTGYCQHGAALDTIISKDVYPNLDAIVAGSRPRNPIQLLNSKEFEVLVGELARRYDRVVFDTPPLGVVSDALNIMPLMDGALYTIRFNTVKRRMARRHVQSLLATNIPIFGAVFNDMNTGLSSGYYVETNSKLFKDYYDVGSAPDAPLPQASREQAG